MRREPYELPFTGRSSDDPTKRRAQVPDEDRRVTYHMGRAYLDESSIRDPDNTITPDEQKVLRQHQLEAAQDRQAHAAANFAAALRLGEALKVLKSEPDDE